MPRLFNGNFSSKLEKNLAQIRQGTFDKIKGDTNYANFIQGARG